MNVPKQPEVNIGTIGHVDHGKTTLTQALSGIWTDRHSEEIKRGISIKLGYADAAFYKIVGKEGPEAFTTQPEVEGEKTELLRCVSFVDSPGHETLMAIMISGAAVMDGAILLVAANEKCPQPQTKEHLMALDLVGIKKIVVVQNKIDLVTEERALENFEEIQRFVKGTVAENAPIIPISAQQGINLDYLVKTLEDVIPTPKRDPKKSARMFIARSFDINRPGMKAEAIKGGVIGGSLISGEFKVGDEIEISPGRKVEDHGRSRWEPITTTVTGLIAGGETYKKVGPGGLLGLGTMLDPSVTKADNLVGKLAGKPGTLPEVRHSLSMDVRLLDRVIGTAEDVKVEPIKTREPLMLNVGTATTVGVVTSARESIIEAALKLPVCSDPGQRVAISRRIGTRWRLIGSGTLKG